MQHGEKSDRNKAMVRRVLDGETLVKVAVDYGITAPCVRQIVYQMWIRITGISDRHVHTWSLADFRRMKRKFFDTF